MSPSYSIVGNDLTALLESHKSDIEVDERGFIRASVTYTGLWPGVVNQSLAVSAHPDFPQAKRKTIKASREEGAEMATVTINFEGVINEGANKTYSLEGTTGTEPIETHPDFATFGGSATPDSTNSKGAMFDDKGKFTGFAVEENAGDYYASDNTNKAGVKSYLAPSIVYGEEDVDGSGTAATRVVASDLGKIDTPPNSNLRPSVTGSFNWLLISLSASEHGDGIRISRKWRLSGPRGFDTDIYS